MKFAFHLQVQALAAAQKEAVGFRAGSLHISRVMEATERFMRDQLMRKRERIFGVDTAPSHTAPTTR
jgi:hypothetical protein